MNGTKMWKPAPSVALYLPSRSTTYAFCCGTTTAVFAMMRTTKAARTRTTIRPAVMLLHLLFGFDPQREPLDALDRAARPMREDRRSARAHRPGRAAQRGFSHAARQQVLGQDRDLTDQRIEVVPVRGRPVEAI